MLTLSTASSLDRRLLENLSWYEYLEIYGVENELALEKHIQFSVFVPVF